MFNRETCKRYIGTKMLYAWPQTRGQYNEYRGWTLPTDEDPLEPGYLVEYTDGGQANHPNHNGYVSWSPADVFERTYRVDVPKPVDNWRTRLLAEAAELKEKYNLLKAFFLTQTYAELPPYDKELLTLQHGYMGGYYDALYERIRHTAEHKELPHGDTL